MFIFDMCRCSSAATPVKYECDSKNFTYFGKIEKFPYGEINERSFSNPHPRSVLTWQTTNQTLRKSWSRRIWVQSCIIALKFNLRLDSTTVVQRLFQSCRLISIWITMIKISLSHDNLIFIMGIPEAAKTVFTWKQSPSSLVCNTNLVVRFPICLATWFWSTFSTLHDDPNIALYITHSNKCCSNI